jgi:flagellar biosynthesis anti-sigma factor FlgM
MLDPIHGVNTPDPVGVASTGQAGTAQAAVSTVPPPAGTGVDSADVAKAEALLAAIKKAADAVPAIDQARIAELQKAINSGIYPPNPQQIAQKIVEIEALLGSKGKIE